MDIKNIKITQTAFTDICSIMDTNYGEVNYDSFKSQDDFLVFMATLIQAAYKIGYRDAVIDK